jgi:gamma-glutamyltranspeptidase/glutathione hydrolase
MMLLHDGSRNCDVRHVERFRLNWLDIYFLYMKAGVPHMPASKSVARSVRLFVASTLLVTASVAGQGDKQVAESEHGVIATAHPLATLAGLRILEAGGNAADAAVAAAFAVSVVRPSMNSIGGRNQIVVARPDGEVFGIDGTTQIPMDYDQETAPRASSGYAVVGIPGAMAGLTRLYREHGSMSLEKLMEPAIDYAENGFRLLTGQARFHTMTAVAIAESEGAAASYLVDGKPRVAGDLLKQPVLAETLRKLLRDGPESFYQGDIARTMARDFERNDGFVTLDDLKNYRAEDSRIVRGSYRGYDLVGLDIPASGALVIQSLQILERFDRSQYSPAGWASLVGQSIALALPDLRLLGTDSGAVRATSKEWAAQQAERIRSSRPSPPNDSSEEPVAELMAQGYTTHISVADKNGMTVALTQTLGPAMGSKVATPGLGFLYASTLGGYLGGEQPPGMRARSGITPIMVFKDGEPFLVLGAAGGIRIISAVVQAVTRVVDDKMTISEALRAPRVHPLVGATGEMTGLDMETVPVRGWGPEAITAIEAMGFRVTSSSRFGSFGRINGLMFDSETGRWRAVSDPGGEGSAGAVVGR